MTQERTWLLATRVAAGIVAVLLVVLIATGIALTFRYEPDVTDAYANVGSLEHRSLLTARSVHQVASTLFVAAVGVLAIASIGLFLVRRNRAPIALSLLAGMSALLAAFTGYLLPWDQLGLWAVTVGTNMRGYTSILDNNHKVRYVLFGSRTTTAATLGHEYWLHAVAVPVVIVGVVAALLFATRRASKLRSAAEE